MLNFPLPRLDLDDKLKNMLLPFCRLKEGEVWNDKEGKHTIACLDAVDGAGIKKHLKAEKPVLAIHDPPYNFVCFGTQEIKEFTSWCSQWINISHGLLADDASLYIWLGADQNNHFEPLADFMVLMRESGFKSRSFITMRNQRGYGTQKNWMSIRQELLFYTKGKPRFNINAEYTDIPKVLRGYYKIVGGKETDNSGRSKSPNIRAGNVWVDIQQVFYRLEENVSGCYAQKPLKAIERIIAAGSNEGEMVIDFFSHSGTTALAAEKLSRKSFSIDLDPLFCEVSIRRIENYRKTGKTGWQNSNPFAEEMKADKKIMNYLKKNYNFTLNKKENITSYGNN